MNATKAFQLSIVISVLACSQGAAQLRLMPNEESLERLPLLREVDFETRTNRQNFRPNANLRIGGILFTNVDAIGPCRQCEPADAVILTLSEQGTMTFPDVPRFVVIDIVNDAAPSEGPVFRVTDGAGRRYRVPSEAIPAGHAFIGLEATYGIREIRFLRLIDDMGDSVPLRMDAVHRTKVATPIKLVARPVWSTQVNLTWRHNSAIETEFLVERSSPDRSNYVQIATLPPDTRSFQDIVSPTNTYFYRVRANHPDGESAYSNQARARTPGPEMRLRLTSIAGEDGFVCEQLAVANRGERAFPNETGPSGLVAGDQSQNQQCKAIISFDTSALPRGPEIVSAVLTLQQGVRVGNPSALGFPLVDMNSGDGFGGSPALQPSDFESAADAVRVAILRPRAGDIRTHVGRLSSFAFPFISNTGRTQFRIYFDQPDNNNSFADFIGWYSGESAGNAPVLEIIYRDSM